MSLLDAVFEFFLENTPFYIFDIYLGVKNEVDKHFQMIHHRDDIFQERSNKIGI